VRQTYNSPIDTTGRPTGVEHTASICCRRLGTVTHQQTTLVLIRLRWDPLWISLHYTGLSESCIVSKRQHGCVLKKSVMS